MKSSKRLSLLYILDLLVAVWIQVPLWASALATGLLALRALGPSFSTVIPRGSITQLTHSQTLKPYSPFEVPLVRVEISSDSECDEFLRES